MLESITGLNAWPGLLSRVALPVTLSMNTSAVNWLDCGGYRINRPLASSQLHGGTAGGVRRRGT